MSVEVKDPTGQVVAALRPGHPCRATIGPVELLVGGPPLIAQNGTTRWTGETGSAGTTLVRDAEKLARVYPIGDPAKAAVFDLQGVAMVRIAVEAGAATISNASGAAVRHVRPTAIGSGAAGFTIDEPALTATGTRDAVLVALLTAPELIPEIRMLAACERTLGGA